MTPEGLTTDQIVDRICNEIGRGYDLATGLPPTLIAQLQIPDIQKIRAAAEQQEVLIELNRYLETSVETSWESAEIEEVWEEHA